MKTELIIAPGTSPAMKKLAESFIPGELMQSYREARHVFRSPDIVMISNEHTGATVAAQRSAYIEQAFLRWNEVQRAAHPIVQGSAQKKLQMPEEALAFWLVVERPEEDMVVCCAVGAYVHQEEDPSELS